MLNRKDSLIVKEAGLRYYNQCKSSNISPGKRNPITHEGITGKDVQIPSDLNPRGPGKGEWSEKSRGSFKLAYSAKELTPPPSKRSEHIPATKNPIVNDPIQTSPSPAKATKYSKFYESNIFKTSDPLIEKKNSRQYDKMLQSNVFNYESDAKTLEPKKFINRPSQVAEILVHYDTAKKINIADKPNHVRINSINVQKNRKEAAQSASVYSARRNNSSVSFSYY